MRRFRWIRFRWRVSHSVPSYCQLTCEIPLLLCLSNLEGHANLTRRYFVIESSNGIRGWVRLLGPDEELLLVVVGRFSTQNITTCFDIFNFRLTLWQEVGPEMRTGTCREPAERIYLEGNDPYRGISMLSLSTSWIRKVVGWLRLESDWLI